MDDEELLMNVGNWGGEEFNGECHNNSVCLAFFFCFLLEGVLGELGLGGRGNGGVKR